MADGFIGKNWGKRVIEFRDRLYYLVRRRGLTMEEAHLAYLATVHSDYWMITYPFKDAKLRFFIEVILGWFSVIAALEKATSREDFLDKYGIPHDTRNLLPRTTEQYPELLKLLGRQHEIKPTKQNEPKIQRPRQD